VNATVTSPRRRLAFGALTAVASAALLLTGAVPASAVTSKLVPESEIGSAYAGDGEVVWLAEEWSGGTHAVTTDVFDGRPALKMMRSGTSSVVNLFRSYGVGERPTAAAGLLDGASYSYAGANVNFQLAMFYTPADLSAYGPAGTVSACTQAVDNGVPRPDMCFTILKFETGQTTTGAYATIRLENAQVPYGGPGNPGWWPTKSVGSYAANSRTGTLDQLLAQMDSYEIYAAGVSVGSGTAAGESWLLDLTFGGTSYGFGSAPSPAAAATPPAADTGELEQLITDEGLDVPQQTSNFVPTGSNTDLGGVDPTAPLEGQYQNWTDPTDAFVDGYTFSTATYVGTFRVVNGNVVVSGANVAHLSKGTHYLLLRGQTSGAVAVVRFTVLGALAVTGADVARLAWTATVGGVAVASGALLMVMGYRRPARGRHRTA